MPVAQSPSYHGYDVSDYYRVARDYGTNDDFKRLVAAAHRRGIKVLVDMVLNHASSEHPFFQEALRDTASPHRNWFRWSPTKPDQKGPWGQEAWHHSQVRDEYYYGIFWSGMPDLNYETPAVRDEAKKVARFWIEEMGVDGFRLDAVPYLVEEGNQLAGTPGTHAMLHEYGSYIRSIAPAAFTVGEVWDSVGAMLPYYPDQLNSYFAFELSDAIINGVRTGSAKNLLRGYLRLQDTMPADRWSPFLRNHDQTRTLTELDGDVRRAKVSATLLLTLPGLPFVYGKAWEAPQPDTLTANVAAEDTVRGSLLNRYRELIHLRASNEALAAGKLVPLSTTSDAVTSYLRQTRNSTVLVVANLGNTTLSGVTVSSAAPVMRAGRYAAKRLLGSSAALSLRVAVDGRIAGYVPLRTLAPMEIYVFELAPLR